MNHCVQTDQLEEFALGGLSETERLALQQHLVDCPACTSIAGDYLEALASVATMMPSISPRRELKDRILNAARSELADGDASTASASPLAERPIGRTPRRLRVPWAAVAAAVIAAVSLAWTVRLTEELESQRSALEQLSRRYDTIVGVLAAQEVNIQLLTATDAAPGSMGRIFLDRDTGTGMVMHRLPPLAEGQVYQLWFVSGGERVSGGVLRSAPDGSGYTLIQAPGPLNYYSEVGVTREPAGGSTWPTGPRLLGCSI